ncbi:MAG: hypothetical protein K0R05_770 [Anaerocolumna sp.]|nr:hypothetical protein [Anaerocolumna sp.]
MNTVTDLTRNTDASGNFTKEKINHLLEEIKTEQKLDNMYHKEVYNTDKKDESGYKYHKVTILIASDANEDVYWYQFHKYPEATDRYKAGEIVLLMGMKSDSLTKSDIIN